MNEFVGTVKIFGGMFAPDGWFYCDGSLLDIASYQVLFSLIGTTYGGDGVTNFALPNLKSNVALHPNTNPGTPSSPTGVNITLGQKLGKATHVLLTNEIPSHQHVVNGVKVEATDNLANGNNFAAIPGIISSGTFVPNNAYNNSAPDTKLNDTSISPTGNSAWHNNVQPSTVLSYVICWNGIYPPRS